MSLYLSLGKKELEYEKQQCIDEGKDISKLLPDFRKIMSLNLENKKNQMLARELLEKTALLPVRKSYKYREPSGLEEIRKLAGKPAGRENKRPNKEKLYDRIYGAWLGRCAGCLLGKPVECWSRKKIEDFLKETNQYPLEYYMNSGSSDSITKKYEIRWNGIFIENIKYMPEDDDTNYTVIGLNIVKQHGLGFTPKDVAVFWLENVPVYHTCTAERIAYRNFVNDTWPPESALKYNEYRELIGAQIRADFWGYVAPGDTRMAAELAWRDASISHVKNGIYGEMWVAAMLAGAYFEDDMKKVIENGLNEIPQTSRLYEAVKEVIKWKEKGISKSEAVDRIHKKHDEKNYYDWCHTISNAVVIAASLLYGEKDFGKTITFAVSAGFDTDCNGATAGSILGLMLGAKKIPAKWIKPMNNTLETGISGYQRVEISKLASETLDLILKL